jgi:hypothetical protein
MQQENDYNSTKITLQNALPLISDSNYVIVDGEVYQRGNEPDPEQRASNLTESTEKNENPGVSLGTKIGAAVIVLIMTLGSLPSILAGSSSAVGLIAGLTGLVIGAMLLWLVILGIASKI